MMRVRRSYTVGLLLFLSAVASSSDAVAQTSSSPESVIESRGLKKKDKFYVVATEGEFFEAFRKVQTIYNLMEAAMNQFKAIVEVENYVLWLGDERTATQAYFGQLNQEIRATPNTIPGRVYIQQLRNEQQECTNYLNWIASQFEIARRRLVPPAKKQAVHDEFMKWRTEFLEANKKLSPISAKAYKQYEELELDTALKDARQTLNERTKANIKLGPSNNLRTAIIELRKAEEMVSFNPDAYRAKKRARNSKVMARDKALAKAKEKSEAKERAGRDLQLISSLNDVKDIPRDGKNRIIVAEVNHVLHFRIFESDGEVIVNIDQNELKEKTKQIEDLRRKLVSLWPPHKLTQNEKDRVVSTVKSIVGQTEEKQTSR